MSLTDERRIVIAEIRDIWKRYTTLPDIQENRANFNMGALNYASFMGERMGLVLDHIADVEAELAAEKAMVAAAVEAQQGLESALAAERAKVVAARVLLQAALDSLDSGRDIYTVRMGIDHFLRQTADPS